FHGVVIEWPLSELRWRRTVGVAVRSDFVKAQTFGDVTVLARRPAVVAGAPWLRVSPSVCLLRAA
ncbi:MAG: hypothetical protein JWM95_2300, partial [Gemmatimonadetes bacterium]|nr:hypothetical protein [Gemmatimonadota bacterium]